MCGEPLEVNNVCVLGYEDLMHFVVQKTSSTRKIWFLKCKHFYVHAPISAVYLPGNVLDHYAVGAKNLCTY